jgi:hypothetical protein
MYQIKKPFDIMNCTLLFLFWKFTLFSSANW